MRASEHGASSDSSWRVSVTSCWGEPGAETAGRLTEVRERRRDNGVAEVKVDVHAFGSRSESEMVVCQRQLLERSRLK